MIPWRCPEAPSRFRFMLRQLSDRFLAKWLRAAISRLSIGNGRAAMISYLQAEIAWRETL
jgi:hypothetical protein